MVYQRKEIDLAQVQRQRDICREILEKNQQAGLAPLAMVDT